MFISFGIITFSTIIGVLNYLNISPFDKIQFPFQLIPFQTPIFMLIIIFLSILVFYITYKNFKNNFKAKEIQFFTCEMQSFWVIFRSNIDLFGYYIYQIGIKFLFTTRYLKKYIHFFGLWGKTAWGFPFAIESACKMANAHDIWHTRPCAVDIINSKNNE